MKKIICFLIFFSYLLTILLAKHNKKLKHKHHQIKNHENHVHLVDDQFLIDLDLIKLSNKIDKVEDILDIVEYPEESLCSSSRGNLAYIEDIRENHLIAKPTYIMLTPQNITLYCRDKPNVVIQTIDLSRVKGVYIPPNWQESPCFQLIGNNDESLVSLCSNDKENSLQWQNKIVNYRNCEKHDTFYK